MKEPERRHWRYSGVSIVDFGKKLSLLLTLF